MYTHRDQHPNYSNYGTGSMHYQVQSFFPFANCFCVLPVLPFSEDTKSCNQKEKMTFFCFLGYFRQKTKREVALHINRITIVGLATTVIQNKNVKSSDQRHLQIHHPTQFARVIKILCSHIKKEASFLIF